MSITCLFFGRIEYQIHCFSVHRGMEQLVEIKKKTTEYAKIFFSDLVKKEKSVDSVELLAVIITIRGWFYNVEFINFIKNKKL